MSRAGTYRFQFCPEFTFADAAGNVSYLAALGISHLYASPYLQATQGSTHGYDVVDHGKVNQELGGEEGRNRLCEALQAHGLKQIVDIVPNHMAIRGGTNAWWWDVLENGPSSRYSSFFDVEWRASDFERVLLPVLGDQYGIELEAGKITLARNQNGFVVKYYEHHNPVAPRALGRLLKPVAQELGSVELGFIADALIELPSPNAPDLASRQRRHRDKLVLMHAVRRMCDAPDVAQAIDLHLQRVNAEPDELHEVLERQTYRLAFWRVGNHELDYRRFFDIDSLVGLRIEDEEVLEATHALVLKWLADGTVDGLRIDHIDGLYDPREYLGRIRQRAPAAWLLVEKILEPEEELPNWPVAGTTGYEFLNQAQRLLVDPQGEAPLSAFYSDVLGQEEDYEQLVDSCKRLVLRDALASDVQRLTKRLADICLLHRRYRDYSHKELEAALIALCVAFPVYRTYVSIGGELSDQDRSMVRRSCRRATEANPRVDPRLFEFFERLLLLEWRGDDEIEFVMRVQQLTGPAMAKGVEDTVFYRYARLVALNEVGGHPLQFALSSDAFHQAMQYRQARFPESLNATSTHDTKRSEDVRARLLVLSEVPDRWQAAVNHWRQQLVGAKTPNVLGEQPAPDARTEYLLWQNLVGAWPIELERMRAYMTKAVREAKLHSSWHTPNEAYEQAIMTYLDAIYDHREVRQSIDEFVESLDAGAVANSLNQTVLKLLCPGVPDIYQGTELWDFSLVDPDNRRAVDYATRTRWLQELERTDANKLWEQRKNGAVKMHVIHQGLSLRQRRAKSFGVQGDYTPLMAQGPFADRVVAFQRGSDVVALVTRFWTKQGDCFDDTFLTLPSGTWRSILNEQGQLTGTVPLSKLMDPFPTAILEMTDP